MPTTTATAAKPLRRKRLTWTKGPAQLERCSGFLSIPARRLLFSGLLAITLALPAVPTAFAQASAANVAAQIKASAGGKLKGFYRTRGYWPLWVREGKVGPEADRLIQLTSTARLDGLKPGKYDPDDLRKTVEAARAGSPEALAKAELELSQTLADYVRDMRRPPAIKMTYLDPELVPERPSQLEVLRAAALAPSFHDYVESTGWMSPIYVRLRDALAEYPERWGKLPHVVIPAGPKLRTGSKHARVALLRQRLGLPPGTTFDKTLTAKVKAFQSDHGLLADGIVGLDTIAALNRGPSHYEQLIRLNLERAKVLPSPFTRHIVVNSAAAQLWAYEGGKQQDTMRVIVGKPTEQTPMLAGILRYAILNPYWNVPSDLVRHRIAPKMLDGASFTKMNYQALSDWSATPQAVDPATIDWSAVAAGSQNLRIRQLPGKTNAMGRMKFMFPNDLGIYLHDTPDKALFKEQQRWFSSGCVRLEDAPRLGKWLFRKPLTAPSKDPEQQVPLPEPVPVYLTYLTASPTPSGLVFLEDAYGRDDAQLRRLANR